MWRRLLRVSSGRSFSSTGAASSFDLVVIGSGPAATQCAIDSASRGKKVAIVDDQTKLGGVCVHTGTVPSKTFREAVLHFTAYRHQGFYGKSYSATDKRVTVHDILTRVSLVVNSEMDSIRSRLKASNIQLINGRASFEDPHTVLVTSTPEAKPLRLNASKFLIACGTKPAHSPMIPCDGVRVLDADHILSGTLVDVPRSLLVVGAGVVGTYRRACHEFLTQ